MDYMCVNIYLSRQAANQNICKHNQPAISANINGVASECNIDSECLFSHHRP